MGDSGVASSRRRCFPLLVSVRQADDLLLLVGWALDVLEYLPLQPSSSQNLTLCVVVPLSRDDRFYWCERC